MKINWRIWMRKSHRWGAIIVAAPFLVVIVTGLLLQLKKEIPWVQPPTVKGSSKKPTITMEQLLKAAQDTPEAEVKTWEDIERVDLQPQKGVAKVQCRNRYEVQVDLKTGDVLQVAYRRSDLIETLHDGSWFHDSAKLYVFLPAAAIVLGLWFTGVYLFILPWRVKWGKKKRQPTTPSS